MARLRRFLAAACVAVLGVSLAGCGGSGDAVQTSLLRGKVTLHKKVIPTGTVTAYRGGSKVMEAPINPDGTYEFLDPSSGEYQLTVTKTDAPTPYSKPIKLPAKYADPAQSGLTATVTSGQPNTKDLELDVK